jgi:hypothetical protein
MTPYNLATERCKQHAKRVGKLGLLVFASCWLLALALFDPEKGGKLLPDYMASDPIR